VSARTREGTGTLWVAGVVCVLALGVGAGAGWLLGERQAVGTDRLAEVQPIAAVPTREPPYAPDEPADFPPLGVDTLAWQRVPLAETDWTWEVPVGWHESQLSDDEEIWRPIPTIGTYSIRADLRNDNLSLAAAINAKKAALETENLDVRYLEEGRDGFLIRYRTERENWKRYNLIRFVTDGGRVTVELTASGRQRDHRQLAALLEHAQGSLRPPG
jgi:hypothetical protein